MSSEINYIPVVFLQILPICVFFSLLQKCNISSTLHNSVWMWPENNNGVSLYLERERRRRAYFYHWFGKHWAAITGQKDGSNYRSLSSLSLCFSSFVADFEFRHKTEECNALHSILIRNWLTERKKIVGFVQQLSFNLCREKHLQQHTRPMIMLCLSDNGCFHKCQFDIMMYTALNYGWWVYCM